MLKEEVVTYIIRRVCDQSLAPRSVTAESRIPEDTNMDSLAIMNFITDLEDRYRLVLPLDKLARVKTVGDLAEIVVQGSLDECSEDT